MFLRGPRPRLYITGYSAGKDKMGRVYKSTGGGVISPQAPPMWTSINSFALPLPFNYAMGQPHGKPQLSMGGIAAQTVSLWLCCGWLAA